MDSAGTRKRRGPITLLCESRRFRWAMTALVVMPVLYVASFGPACWINLRTGGGGRAIGMFYRPIGWLYLRSGNAVGRGVGAWAELGGFDDWGFYGLADDGPIWLLPISSIPIASEVPEFGQYSHPEPD